MVNHGDVDSSLVCPAFAYNHLVKHTARVLPYGVKSERPCAWLMPILYHHVCGVRLVRESGVDDTPMFPPLIAVRCEDVRSPYPESKQEKLNEKMTKRIVRIHTV